jgi:uncharacterized protein
MSIKQPIEPTKRIEIIDILRGFALLGIIFMNMSFFSGYAYMPFEDLKHITNFPLDEKLHTFLEIIVTGKFYTIFSILFAVGFYIQLNKNNEDSVNFLKTYRRRLFILLLIGLIHGLFWSGDILFTYAIYGFIIILFRNVKPKNLFRWSFFFIFIQVAIDFALLPFTEVLLAINPANTSALPIAHLSYPDMTNGELIYTYQEGSVLDIVKLNVHNTIWKWMSYIPSGQYFKFLGIFLLGYYLASIEFFTKKPKSTLLMVGILIIGLVITISANLLGGVSYGVPTPNDILYKVLFIVGQLLMGIAYIMAITKIAQFSTGIKVLKYLIPVGRMALSNYILQTVFMVLIFYSFGFGLFGKIGLMTTMGIAILIVIAQLVLSNLWLKHFRFGPLEWLWRSLTYKKWIKIRYQDE